MPILPYGIYNPLLQGGAGAFVIRKFKLASGEDEVQELIVRAMKDIGLRPEDVLGGISTSSVEERGRGSCLPGHFPRVHTIRGRTCRRFAKSEKGVDRVFLLGGRINEVRKGAWEVAVLPQKFVVGKRFVA